MDESWKDEVSKQGEKEAKKETARKSEEAKKGTKTSLESQKKFINFLMGIATQALYLMGAIEGGPEQDLEGAKEMIGILELLKERTTGNLSSEEQKAMDKILYDLQMKFVELTEASVPPPPPSS